MVTRWIQHVQDVAKKQNITYKEAMRVAKKTYVKNPVGAPPRKKRKKGRGTRKGEARLTARRAYMETPFPSGVHQKRLALVAPMATLRGGHDADADKAQHTAAPHDTAGGDGAHKHVGTMSKVGTHLKAAGHDLGKAMKSLVGGGTRKGMRRRTARRAYRGLRRRRRRRGTRTGMRRRTARRAYRGLRRRRRRRGGGTKKGQRRKTVDVRRAYVRRGSRVRRRRRRGQTTRKGMRRRRVSARRAYTYTKLYPRL